jgi:exodeoxyribonuclease III
VRIISYNVNGIRAAIKKGFIDWLKTNPADIICLQEIKAARGDLDVKQLEALGFHHHWYSAQKKDTVVLPFFHPFDQCLFPFRHKW